MNVTISFRDRRDFLIKTRWRTRRAARKLINAVAFSTRADRQPKALRTRQTWKIDSDDNEYCVRARQPAIEDPGLFDRKG